MHTYNFGSQEYTKKNLTPVDILDLAMAYSQAPTNKLVGKNMDNGIRIANDLAKLTGGGQQKPGLQPGNKAIILFTLKNGLVTAAEYKKLYTDLVDRHKFVLNKLKKASPNSGGGSVAAKQAAEKDMEGEFNTDESIFSSKSLTEGGKITSIPKLNLESDVYIVMKSLLKNSGAFKKMIADYIMDYYKGGSAKTISDKLSNGLHQSVVTPTFLSSVMQTVNKSGPRLALNTPQLKDPAILKRFAAVLAMGILWDADENPVDTAKLTGNANVIKAANDFSVNRGKGKFSNMMTHSNVGESTIHELISIIKTNKLKEIKDPIANKMVSVDVDTAKRIVATYHSLTESNKKQYASNSISKMDVIAIKLL